MSVIKLFGKVQSTYLHSNKHQKQQFVKHRQTRTHENKLHTYEISYTPQIIKQQIKRKQNKVPTS